MNKHTRRFFAAISLALAVGIAASAQTTGTPPIKIQLVVSEQGISGTPAVQPRTVSLVANPTGKFKVDLKSVERSFPPGCGYNVATITAHNPQPQRVGTQLEGTVNPAPEGRFQVQLTLTERTVEGCRAVGDLNIPVFANRIIQHTVVVGSGEMAPFTFGGKFETLRVEFTLTSEF
jgi:hypothetical protein